MSTIKEQVQTARDRMYQHLMENDPQFRDGVLSEHLKSIKDAQETLDTMRNVLSSYGYTWHVVTPDHGDNVEVAVHPDYLEVFNAHYDAFVMFPPEMNVPAWAAIMM